MSAPQPAPAIRAASPWPPDLAGECRRRIRLLDRLRSSPELLQAVKAHLARSPVDFVRDWVWTYDPRRAAAGAPTHLPLVPWPRQEDFLRWLDGRLAAQENGAVDKTRDAGATWLCASFAAHGWLFRDGFAAGFGSRKEQLVDKLGDPDSIFEKLRYVLQHLPREFLPVGFDWGRHSAYMRLINPETGGTITGEAGDNIGRGGRKTIYFVDESAFLERPMKIEGALSNNTDVRIDVSTTNGPGTPFHAKLVGYPSEKVFSFDWRDDPRKDDEWYRRKSEGTDPIIMAREVDRDPYAAVEGQLIEGRWVQAALRLDLEPSGQVIAGFDAADEGRDNHGFCVRRGWVLLRAEEWRDKRGTTQVARRAWAEAEEAGAEILRYEKEGVGAAASGVAKDLAGKGRVKMQGVHPGSTKLPGWHQKPQNGDGGKKNADMFANLKAMAWWGLRDRFRKTWEHVEGQKRHPPEDLISLRRLPPGAHRNKLVSELSQVQYDMTPSGKVKIIKAPEGNASPNVADSVVISDMVVRLSVGVW